MHFDFTSWVSWCGDCESSVNGLGHCGCDVLVGLLLPRSVGTVGHAVEVLPTTLGQVIRRACGLAPRPAMPRPLSPISVPPRYRFAGVTCHTATRSLQRGP